MIKHLWTGLLDLIFPRNCLLCKTYDEHTAENPLCPACQHTIPYNHPPFCLKCSRHLNQFTTLGLCRDCEKHLPAFDQAWGLTQYKDPLPALVQAFKFHNKTSLRKTFSKIATEFLTRYPLNLKHIHMIIPMPLSPTRLRERGYNQTLLLAEGLSQLLKIPCVTGELLRARHLPRQSTLGEKERWTNIHDAFKIKNSLRLKGKNILLVDDLLTTGATASEAARTLKDAGALNVTVMVLSIA